MSKECKFSADIEGDTCCSLSVFEWGTSRSAIRCSGTDEDKKDCPFWSGKVPVVRKLRKVKDRIDHVVESVQSAPE